MIINSLQNNDYLNNKAPKFKAWRRKVLDTNKVHVIGEKPLHMNNTYFFRLPKFWDKAYNFIINKYKNVSKVNVYNYACSDGSEPLSMLMYLKSKYAEIADKFFPIIAKDYDPVAINKAKSGIYEIGDMEKANINQFTSGSFLNFFTKLNKNKKSDRNYIFNNELSKDVEFNVADVLKDYKKIKSKNSLVMARNFWPYLSDEDKVKLAYGLSSKMSKNCTLMIGEFDLENRWSVLDISSVLKEAGFKPTNNEMIFEK